MCGLIHKFFIFYEDLTISRKSQSAIYFLIRNYKIIMYLNNGKTISKIVKTILTSVKTAKLINKIGIMFSCYHIIKCLL